jgi:hypothetical protein
MPNQIPLVEQQLPAFALSHPGFGSGGIASEMKKPVCELKPTSLLTAAKLRRLRQLIPPGV